MAIHHTALVNRRAEIAQDVEIGPFAIIDEDVQIGAGCRVDAHVTVKRYTTLGQRNHVYHHAVLGGEPQHTDFRGEASSLIVGDDNVVREHATMNRGSGEGSITRIGSRNHFMVAAHVGHNCVIGSDCEIGTNTMLGGYVVVEDHASVGYAMRVHQYVRVGRYAAVGDNSKIVQDALPFVMTNGDPCRIRSLNTAALERAGFSADQRGRLERALHVLLHAGLSRDRALTEMKQIDDPSVAQLAEFVRRSARGFTREPRKRYVSTAALAA